MHSYKASIGLWIFLAGAALLLDSVVVLFTHSYKERLTKEIYSDASFELKAHASALASAIGSKLDLAKGLKAFAVEELAHSGSVEPARFETFASNFMKDIPGIRNFSVYPDGISTMVYPKEGNEAMLGLNLFRHKDQSVRENAERTRLAGRMTVLGPIELAQGGQGLLSREPIYLEGRFWGFVSVVLDIPSILKEADLYDRNKGIEFAVRANGQILLGISERFDNPPLRETVKLPEGQWEMAAVPSAARLDSIASKIRLVQTIGWCSILLILFFLYSQFTQKARLKKLVEERTHNLEAANKQLEITYRELAATAYQDVVTGLRNRSAFNEALTVWDQERLERQEQQESASKLALLYLDMDQFKMINDTLGHSSGDQLLREVGSRLSAILEEEQTLFRIGGDEFSILLPSLENAGQVERFAQRVCDLFAQPFVLRESEYFITASIGIALYPDHARNGAELVRNADIAMYRAKEEGKNQYRFYDVTLDPSSEEAIEIASYLRRALEKQEIFMHYQPQVEAGSGRIIGLEALIRWQHPKKGLIPPNRFIPIAEETGLILPISEKVLHLVCAQSRAWQDAGLPPVRIAINLSARQFSQRDFAVRLTEIVAEYGLSPCCLELEITEMMAMKDDLQPVLLELKDKGFTLSIDDFGVQYSSLNYLKKLPVDKIKIDRSFVSGIARDRKDEAIIVAMLQIADRLNLTVIAEGVETNEQLEFLRSNNCQEIQGFIFHKPQPADQIEALLLAESRERGRQGNKSAEEG